MRTRNAFALNVLVVLATSLLAVNGSAVANACCRFGGRAQRRQREAASDRGNQSKEFQSTLKNLVLIDSDL